MAIDDAAKGSNCCSFAQTPAAELPRGLQLSAEPQNRFLATRAGSREERLLDESGGCDGISRSSWFVLREDSFRNSELTFTPRKHRPPWFPQRDGGHEFHELTLRSRNAKRHA
jgi:hypothetical protein